MRSLLAGSGDQDLIKRSRTAKLDPGIIKNIGSSQCPSKLRVEKNAFLTPDNAFIVLTSTSTLLQTTFSSGIIAYFVLGGLPGIKATVSGMCFEREDGKKFWSLTVSGCNYAVAFFFVMMVLPGLRKQRRHWCSLLPPNQESSIFGTAEYQNWNSLTIGRYCLDNEFYRLIRGQDGESGR
ncbi:hypothetical protein EDD18DRAFT_1106718 [Armillaria luteobubalina]|uniref:Uncharacterized protein n=1 Tax=Armillaria luteobubalina TaxID=153913 RepID=A0AA39UM00_9AGAR|nr:hypothetical protein EDD18DRAFT_1106718 [Armillaria luteobubalina]